VIGTASITTSETSGYRKPEDYFETVNHSTRGTQSKKFLPGDFAEDVVREERLITIADDGQMFFYEDGVYRPKGEVFVEQKLCSVLGHHRRFVSRNQKLEVIDHVKMLTHAWRKDLRDDPSLLPVKNGVMNWRSGTFEPYDRDRHQFFFQIPVDYDPGARCPRIDAFLGSVVEAHETEPLVEIAAFCLYRKCMKQFVVLVGACDAGKTQYLELLRSLLGEENTCTVPLHSLARDKFALCVLKDRMANIYDDLSSKALEDTGLLKALTGRGKVPYEPKYKDRTDFRPCAKHIFACNAIPRPPQDESAAFFERFVIVLFPNTFVQGQPTPGSNERMAMPQEDLQKLLTDPSELSGFLNLAIGLMDKVARQGLSVSPRSKELRTKYEQRSNSLGTFLRGQCEVGGPDMSCTKEAFYRAFVMYCEQHDLPTLSKNAVGQGLPGLDPRIETCRKRFEPGKRRPRKWKGVRLKPQRITVRWGTESLIEEDSEMVALLESGLPLTTVPTCTQDSCTSLLFSRKTRATESPPGFTARGDES